MHWPCCVLEPAGRLDQSLKVTDGGLLFACHQYLSGMRSTTQWPPMWQQPKAFFLFWPLWLISSGLQIGSISLGDPYLTSKIPISLLTPLSRPRSLLTFRPVCMYVVPSTPYHTAIPLLFFPPPAWGDNRRNRFVIGKQDPQTVAVASCEKVEQTLSQRYPMLAYVVGILNPC